MKNRPFFKIMQNFTTLIKVQPLWYLRCYKHLWCCFMMSAFPVHRLVQLKPKLFLCFLITLFRSNAIPSPADAWDLNSFNLSTHLHPFQPTMPAPPSFFLPSQGHFTVRCVKSRSLAACLSKICEVELVKDMRPGQRERGEGERRDIQPVICGSRPNSYLIFVIFCINLCFRNPGTM